jgi:hypothetical protein
MDVACIRPRVTGNIAVWGFAASGAGAGETGPALASILAFGGGDASGPPDCAQAVKPSPGRSTKKRKIDLNCQL